jgi:carbonic anhydrase
MLTFEDEPVREQISKTQGADADLPLLPFPDLESNVRAQVERIQSHPWTRDVPVTGLIYEVESGRLRQVS